MRFHILSFRHNDPFWFRLLAMTWNSSNVVFLTPHAQVQFRNILQTLGSSSLQFEFADMLFRVRWIMHPGWKAESIGSTCKHGRSGIALVVEIELHCLRRHRKWFVRKQGSLRVRNLVERLEMDVIKWFNGNNFTKNLKIKNIPQQSGSDRFNQENEQVVQ